VSEQHVIPEAEWLVSSESGGAHLDRIVRAQFPEASWNQIRVWIRGGNVLVDRSAVSDPTAVVEAGRQIVVTARPGEKRNKAPRSASPTSPKLIVFSDSQVVVVEKPAGISTVPYDKEERDTLDRRLMGHLARGKSRAKVFLVHRIDKETTGLLVFARTQDAQERLKSQFRFHTVERRYLALVYGHPRSQTIKSNLVQDRGDGLRGSTQNPGLGRSATTHVRVVEQFPNASLVECRLETGRTHQIRIHLAEAGHPLLGDRVYTKGYEGKPIPAVRVMLHAASLGFDHPSHEGRRISFESEMPADMVAQRLTLKKK
jgi:23S rRNA pseudouridine1911/1915/1917 synthase